MADNKTKPEYTPLTPEPTEPAKSGGNFPQYQEAHDAQKELHLDLLLEQNENG